MTDESVESERVLQRYIDGILEDMNFKLCSEIWNDCLLLPSVYKEDPAIAIDSMVVDFIAEIIQESIIESK